MWERKQPIDYIIFLYIHRINKIDIALNNQGYIYVCLSFFIFWRVKQWQGHKKNNLIK